MVLCRLHVTAAQRTQPALSLPPSHLSYPYHPFTLLPGYTSQIHFNERSHVWIPANDPTACDMIVLFPLPSRCPFLFRLAKQTDARNFVLKAMTQRSEVADFEQ
jgi:hypothetical protein